MARVTSATIEKQLAKLKAFEPARAGAADELRAAFAVPNGRVVAAAAKLAAEHVLGAVADAMADAFTALCEDASKRDPGCTGKVAIVEALQALDVWDDRVFAVGVRYRQPEGWAGQGPGARRTDSAVALRGLCAFAHAHFLREDALDLLADLLADDEPVARIAAARGLGASGRRDATALLRYKLHVGDSEPEVLATCIESLLDLARDTSLPFVLELLADHDPRAEAAVVGLGGARIAEAFEPICAWASAARPAQRHRVAYVALALLRHEPATDYLLNAVAHNAAADALAAAEALSTFKHDPVIAARIRAAAGEQKSSATRADIEALLD